MNPETSHKITPEERLGLQNAFMAYGAWGLFPLYWKLLSHIPPLEVLLHRVFWAFCFYSIMQRFKEKKWAWKFNFSKATLKALSLSSVLLGLNWFIYIAAVQTHQVLEASLGYFISPLLNMALGALLLKEPLSTTKKLTFLLALVGVLFIAQDLGHPPWIALSLGLSFSLYGLLRKKTHVSAWEGGRYEALFFLPWALGAWVFLKPPVVQTTSNFYQYKDILLLMISGPLTGWPLLWFAKAAKELSLYTLGLMQYISPTLQFFVGIWILNEPLSTLKMMGFASIWLGLGLHQTYFYLSKKRLLQKN